MKFLPHSRLIFSIAAGMNILGALTALASISMHFQMFYASPPPTDAIGIFYHYKFWAMVLCMGVRSIFVARAPERHKGLIAVGAAGKLTAALSWAAMFAVGKAEVIILSGVAYDLAFGVIFLLILAEMRRNESSNKA